MKFIIYLLPFVLLAQGASADTKGQCDDMAIKGALKKAKFEFPKDQVDGIESNGVGLMLDGNLIDVVKVTLKSGKTKTYFFRAQSMGIYYDDAESACMVWPSNEKGIPSQNFID